ncbi:PREDICTED: pheromone-binding protein Gp-9-like [Vollenhovia emeryi]|uniref:pheromone-binding protein Gp-9-like n=1 Tax=Vollenhovia emeryi TaxID=411798 RepID=UPI0005F4F1C0|nr:PREDICTED: pheromone-binding protein Gp-9-like [Vollenhovia emeryi]
MKGLVLCVCVLIIASSAELKQPKNVTEILEASLETCATELTVDKRDLYREEDIMNNLHTQPGNEERTRKNGCFLACLLKKQNLMEGTDIKESEVEEKITELFEDNPFQTLAQTITRKCLKQARSDAEECEKGFTLFACAARILHSVQHHAEHTREETEAEIETEQPL